MAIQTYLIAMGLILLLLVGWVAVQYFARAFAAKHPELGPAREEGGGCGTAHCSSCGTQNTCKTGEEER
jgi:positive regulator of sigma E activity